MQTTIEIGARGEQIAIDYLRSKGYLICEKNWRSGRYEIDIIAQKWEVLHFVEVKTRKAGGWTTPEESINKNKRDALRKAITAYRAERAARGEFQVDLVAIEIADDGSHEIRIIEKMM